MSTPSIVSPATPLDPADPFSLPESASAPFTLASAASFDSDTLLSIDAWLPEAWTDEPFSGTSLITCGTKALANDSGIALSSLISLSVKLGSLEGT